MFTKILIANRGEIACRVMRTARRLGIRSVAVYSDADAQAKHVREADEAVHIGPAAARESYLRGDRIIEAALRTGAQAIHPGYGFLSENEDFAEACAKAGLAFIGPPAGAIRAMGSKSAAKALMEKAGVPLTPGYHGDEQAPAFLARQSEQIGWPVLIKASAGGGGKGMRRVDRAEDFEAALAGCKREAINAFGDDHVLVEKYVLRPRHIEIQVFADTHGNCVHLHERDCSVQRRHQKVLEEAPAPGMTPERRAAMGQAAVDAAKAVGYVGAGTVEFIVQPDGRFFFMEMNTRLQVEHPVTEMITGLDLVEWQLRVAAGEPLPLRQDQIPLQGHAIEARVYAEDPQRGFLPSTGRLLHLRAGAAAEHVRLDSGVDEGDTITPHYDPMIAKLIVWGPDREAARLRLGQALSRLQIVGVGNNAAFLRRLVDSRAFASADLDTALIEREHAALFPTQQAAGDEVFQLATLARLLAAAQASSASDPRGAAFARVGEWRLNAPALRRWSWQLGEQSVEVLSERAASGWKLSIGGRSIEARAAWTSSGELDATLAGRRLHATVVDTAGASHLFHDGQSYALALHDPLHADRSHHAAEGGLTAPLPGRLVAHLVKSGTQVTRGTPVLVLEAMKMEHTLTAPSDGLVRAFLHAEGAQVAEGAALVEFEAAA
ncbi:MAG: acetyl/propionyl/methylcrotonyl-CoA carboxylase subunit alpha [Aquabacterium sp.]|nr:MAG: acetyl/propionyl/methylcrotonyl-CoA carboxylase subunit alpha [Aquabacterium sp.]